MSYPKHSVYLAGTITGLTHDEARYGWRKEFDELMEPYDHIFCSSPMRGKEMLEDFGVLTSGKGYPDYAMTSPAGIVTRDRNDVKLCSVMVACFLESKGKLSGGTFIEFGWADLFGKPTVVIGPEDDPNVQHLMSQHLAGYRVDTLEEAALIVGHLLTPGL
jgi:hypothetical protein